jgi:hypothetical protein
MANRFRDLFSFIIRKDSCLLKKWPLLILDALHSQMKQMGKIRFPIICLNGRNSDISFWARYVPSEGAVAFILKTRSAASRDGNSVLVVVKSTDTKHGGRSQGPSSPNVNTQIALQESLLEKASLKPFEIEYVYMCHDFV